ncbi:MAG: zinc-binding dehydrogenase [Polyangiaceae bacterium]
MTGVWLGAHAEQATVAFDHCVVRLPDDVPFEAAITLPFGGTTALTFLEARARVQPGERVLVIGAAGAVGAACVQVARNLGARVTGVCSGGNRELVRSLGAERVIDYAVEDVFAGGEKWDVVVDTVGRAPVSALRRIAGSEAGWRWWPRASRRYCTGAVGRADEPPAALVGPAEERPDYLDRLIGWWREGRWTPVIDGQWTTGRSAAAHARVDSHRKRGSALLVVDGAPSRQEVSRRLNPAGAPARAVSGLAR